MKNGIFFIIRFIVSISLISYALSRTNFSTVPISIKGLGLQDGAYVFFLSQMGVPAAAALSLSLSLHFIRYFLSMIGGILFLFEKK